MADHRLRSLVAPFDITQLLRAPIVLLPTYSKLFGESQTTANVVLVTALLLVTANVIFTSRRNTRNQVIRGTYIAQLLYVGLEIFNIFKAFPLTGCTLSTIRCYILLAATAAQVLLLVRHDDHYNPYESIINLFDFVIQIFALPGLGRLALDDTKSGPFTTIGAIVVIFLVVWFAMAAGMISADVEGFKDKKQKEEDLDANETLTPEHTTSVSTFFITFVNAWLLVLIQYA